VVSVKIAINSKKKNYQKRLNKIKSSNHLKNANSLVLHVVFNYPAKSENLNLATFFCKRDLGVVKFGHASHFSMTMPCNLIKTTICRV
jgi:hypothetical protein